MVETLRDAPWQIASPGLRSVVESLDTPAYVTDFSNRVCWVNRRYAALVGDPLKDGFRDDELFVLYLMLGPYRDRFPRRREEISSCAASLVSEIEERRLSPSISRLYRKAAGLDPDCSRMARRVVEGEIEFGWDGTVVLRGRDGEWQSLRETVIPLNSPECLRASFYLNVWLPADAADSGRSDIFALKALTGRQREVAVLLARGYSAGGVAAALGISIHTARDHRDEIYRRLGIRSRAELGAVLANR